TYWPVPERAKSNVIESTGSVMLSPRRTWFRPNDLCTSMNSIASGLPDGRTTPVWNGNSSSTPSGGRSSVRSSAISLAADRRARVGAPEDLRPEHPDRVYQHDVQDH